MTEKKIDMLFLIFILFLTPSFALAQTSAGGVSQQESEIERLKGLEKRINQKPVETTVENPVQKKTEGSQQTVLINTIKLEGAQLLTTQEIEKIITPFEGKQLSLDGMQEVADRLTEAYRKKGYITSRAYIPQQAIKDNVLDIKVLEAKMGTIDVQGNRYFSTEQLRKRINLQTGAYFDFTALQKSLVFINEHPDRLAKAVLVPGKEPGATDLILQVEDQRPIHVGLVYDNYASRFVNSNEYALTFEHNNLTKHDDILFLKAQVSDASRLFIEQFRYLMSLNQNWDVGIYGINSHSKLDRQFAALNAVGDAHVLGIFGSRKLIKNSDVDLRLNLGFDYKSIRDEVLSVETSHDELRILKAGFDFDFNDQWGRNIFTAGLDSGIPDFLGASSAKDSSASRVGAGGRFDKFDFTYFRLQPLPFSTSLLFKNIAQYSSYKLTSSEQFQMGGALSVRGYPSGEASGDSGIYSSLEWSLPVYFISSNIKVPFSKTEKLVDALRLVFFYDIATTSNNDPAAGVKGSDTLRGFGYGLRFNVKDNVAIRIEIGYPEGQKSSDNKSAHPWVECSIKF